MVSALDFQAGYRGFESRSGRDNFQTISAPSSYSTCPGLSIKWTGRRLVTDSGTKCAWVIHESKAVQIHVYHSNRRCLYVPRVPGSVKNLHNNNCSVLKIIYDDVIETLNSNQKKKKKKKKKKMATSLFILHMDQIYKIRKTKLFYRRDLRCGLH